jgi:hypothetical protein
MNARGTRAPSKSTGGGLQAHCGTGKSTVLESPADASISVLHTKYG